MAFEGLENLATRSRLAFGIQRYALEGRARQAPGTSRNSFAPLAHAQTLADVLQGAKNLATSVGRALHVLPDKVKEAKEEGDRAVKREWEGCWNGKGNVAS